LEIHLAGVKTNRYGLGSMVGVFRKDEKPLWRRARTDGSYLSASDSRVHFGLGSNPQIEVVAVEWLAASARSGKMWRPTTWSRCTRDRVSPGSGTDRNLIATEEYFQTTDHGMRDANLWSRRFLEEVESFEVKRGTAL